MQPDPRDPGKRLHDGPPSMALRPEATRRAQRKQPMPLTDTPRSDAALHGSMPEGRAMLPSPARTALREAAAALDRAEQFHQPLEMTLALAQMARCYRGLKAFVPAERYLERALAWAHTLGAIDQSVEILCLLAETSCSIAETQSQSQSQMHSHSRSGARGGHAARERTRDRVFEVVGMAGHVADPQWEIKVLLRISDVLDRCGDHGDAVELQSRAMRLMYGPHAGVEQPAEAAPEPPGR